VPRPWDSIGRLNCRVLVDPEIRSGLGMYTISVDFIPCRHGNLIVLDLAIDDSLSIFLLLKSGPISGYSHPLLRSSEFFSHYFLSSITPGVLGPQYLLFRRQKDH
jgi:hypothetical protein